MGYGFNLGSHWLIDEEQRNHPYILDCYYILRRRSMSFAGFGEDVPAVTSEVRLQMPEDIWAPFSFGQHEDRQEHSWEHHDYGDRSNSHLGASTSTPLFRESVFNPHDSGNNSGHNVRSHWWARSGPHDTQVQTSFIDPPDFHRYAHDNHQDGYSDRSLEEEGLDWRIPQRLDRTTYGEDFEDSGDVSLHFDDIYSRPPDTPPGNLERTSFM